MLHSSLNTIHFTKYLYIVSFHQCNTFYVFHYIQLFYSFMYIYVSINFNLLATSLDPVFRSKNNIANIIEDLHHAFFLVAILLKSNLCANFSYHLYEVQQRQINMS